MIILYVLFSVYILAVNFYAFRLVKSQYENYEDGKKTTFGDGKLYLAALFGGAVAVYCSMFALKFRLGNFALMILMPLMAVLNFYCFFLGFRGIYLLL